MTATTTAKTERLVARVSPQQKELIEHAATLAGLSMTDFILQSVQGAAEKTIREHQVLTLSVRDSRIFAEAVLNPPEPNEALRDAARRAPTRIAYAPGRDGE